ncbi:MAG: class I SAM-dependent methyltransferase [Bacteroidota bacterium]
MKPKIDQFSKQAVTYKKFRPTYPSNLYGYILDFVGERKACWDCGTGNGQVASVLAAHFEQVYATDISQKQIDQATLHSKIEYSIQSAEQTNFPDQTFDLIAVAQALHWFDHPAFELEVKRVAKPGAILATWGYNLLRINPQINALLDYFYKSTVGPYWHPRRKHVDNSYTDISFDLEPIAVTNEFSITVHWNLDQVQGYFNSWSSVQNYLIKNPGENPVDQLIADLKPRWKDQQIQFPLFLNLWRVG